MSNQDTKFFGSIKEANVKFGTLLNGGFTKENLEEMLSLVNENGWFNFTIAKSQKGNWYIKQNDFKPSGQAPVNGGDDLPY